MKRRCYFEGYVKERGKEGGGLLSREEGMGGLCQGKKGRGDGRLMSREEVKREG